MVRAVEWTCVTHMYMELMAHSFVAGEPHILSQGASSHGGSWARRPERCAFSSSRAVSSVPSMAVGTAARPAKSCRVPLTSVGRRPNRSSKDGLCGYLRSSSDVMEGHGRLLSQHYSRKLDDPTSHFESGLASSMPSPHLRTDWHKRQTRMKAVLERNL